MNLPVFNDNLRSSGSWSALLAQERAAWEQTRGARLARVREEQSAQALLRAAQQGQELAANNVANAAQLIAAWAQEAESKFSVARLLEVQRALLGAAATEDVLRRTEPLPLNALHDPVPALLLPRMLDSACDWFTTEGFNEMHAVEQAAVVYLRLLDLHPFPALNETPALLAASFYTERAGWPPLIIFADEITAARHASVLEAAFRLLTQPLVEFFAEMLTRAMRLGDEP